MTGPVPALPADMDTSDFDPDGDDHWRLQSGHVYRSRLIEDQSDGPDVSRFTYEGRAGGLAYFSQTNRATRSVRHFALPPAQLEQAFHFHRPGEHDRSVPVNPLTAPGGPRMAADGPQAQPGAPGQAPPNGASNAPTAPPHEPIDTSGVTLSRTR